MPATITIDGTDHQGRPLGCKRKLAYIPDNPDLYDYMTGIKYLSFIADVFGVDAQTRQARIRNTATFSRSPTIWLNPLPPIPTA